jgi:hypothetical protein
MIMNEIPNPGLHLKQLQLLSFLIAVFIIPLTGCRNHASNAADLNSPDPWRVIADAHATTNSVIHALQAIQSLKTTNEPPAFWSAIANDPGFSADHRRRAVLQLLARHFKPGMTVQEIGNLLNHPNWFTASDCLPFGSGAPPPGGDLDDDWFLIVILNDHHNSPAIWFRCKAMPPTTMDDLCKSLKGEPIRAPICQLRIIGIASDEIVGPDPIRFNRFGIPPYAPESAPLGSISHAPPDASHAPYEPESAPVYEPESAPVGNQ